MKQREKVSSYMLFGRDSRDILILALIGLKRCDIERYGGCWIENGKIVVLTKTGGPNRQDYPNEKLHQNPYFERTYDADFDSTYAYFVFRIPDEIKDDVKGLEDPETYGISAKLIQWIMRTLRRDPTPEDIRAAIIEKQERVARNLNNAHMAQIWNGHTVVPLCDEAFEALASVAEENDGKFITYSLMPYKVRVIRYGFEADWERREDGNMWSACITQPRGKWEIDMRMWKRWKRKFKDRYPKTIAVLESQIRKELNRSKKWKRNSS